jgi:hypothetical protein
MIEILLLLIVVLLVAFNSKKEKPEIYSGYLDDEQFPFREIKKIYKDANGIDCWGLLKEIVDESFWINGYGLVQQTRIKGCMVQEFVKDDSSLITNLVDTDVLMTVSENVNSQSPWIGFYKKNDNADSKLYLQLTIQTYNHILDILKNKKSNDGLVFFMFGNRCNAKGRLMEIEGYLINSINETQIISYDKFIKTHIS